jgi:hypothetical protein
MTLLTIHQTAWRPGRFRLRTLLIAVSLACLVSSIYGRRQRRAEYLARLVDEFNVALGDQRYARADRLANEAVREFPNETAAEYMVEKSKLAQRIIHGEETGERGGGCLPP